MKHIFREPIKLERWQSDALLFTTAIFTLQTQSCKLLETVSLESSFMGPSTKSTWGSASYAAKSHSHLATLSKRKVAVITEWRSHSVDNKFESQRSWCIQRSKQHSDLYIHVKFTNSVLYITLFLINILLRFKVINISIFRHYKFKNKLVII